MFCKECTSSATDEKIRGGGFAFLGIFQMSIQGVAYKLIVARLGGLMSTYFIAIIAMLTLLAILLFNRKTAVIVTEYKRRPIFYALAGMAGLGLQQLLYISGYEYLPASQVIIIYYLYPLLMVVFSSIIYREQMSYISVLCVISGFFGVYLVASNGSLLHIHWNIGIILVFLAAICWGLFSTLIKNHTGDLIAGMFLFNFFGVVFLTCFVPFQSIKISITATELVGILMIGIFPTALGILSWSKGLRMAGTAICSNIALLSPILALIWIFLILKEHIAMVQLAGFGVILVSVFLNLNLATVRPLQIKGEGR